MRGFIIALVVLGLHMLSFWGGLFAASSGLLLLGFLSAPLAWCWVGWSARTVFAGRRVALIDQREDGYLKQIRQRGRTVTQ